MPWHDGVETLQEGFAQNTSSLNEQDEVKWVWDLHRHRSDSAAGKELHPVASELHIFSPLFWRYSEPF